MANTTVNRHKERGKYDLETAYSILDEALFCHAAFLQDGIPYNIPMIHVRIGNLLYIHSSAKSRFYEAIAGGTQVCITATILDALVFAKSAYNSSVNYRSVMVFGKMSPVIEKAEKMTVAEHLIEKMAKGRWFDCRIPNERELNSTGMVKIPITEFSSKVRNGPPVDNHEDQSLPYWSGIIPVRMQFGEPLTSPADTPNQRIPEYLKLEKFQNPQD